jgi:uncharacterized protein (DUF1697 family)
MTGYVAFLRGINVGGNKKVPMAQLKKVMEKLGYGNVKTLLASGNVLFDASGSDATVASKIEKTLASAFGFTIPVILRRKADLEKLAESDPFKGITVTPETRLYVTFLRDKPKSTLKIPYASPDGNYRILRVSGMEIISVLQLTDGSRTVDAMAVLEKEFGKDVTTRNWNTVEKVLR